MTPVGAPENDAIRYANYTESATIIAPPPRDLSLLVKMAVLIFLEGKSLVSVNNEQVNTGCHYYRLMDNQCQ